MKKHEVISLELDALFSIVIHFQSRAPVRVNPYGLNNIFMLRNKLFFCVQWLPINKGLGASRCYIIYDRKGYYRAKLDTTLEEIELLFTFKHQNSEFEILSYGDYFQEWAEKTL